MSNERGPSLYSHNQFNISLFVKFRNSQFFQDLYSWVSGFHIHLVHLQNTQCSPVREKQIIQQYRESNTSSGRKRLKRTSYFLNYFCKYSVNLSLFTFSVLHQTEKSFANPTPGLKTQFLSLSFLHFNITLQETRSACAREDSGSEGGRGWCREGRVWGHGLASGLCFPSLDADSES